jgi:N,N-dimethylformamidase
MQVGKILGYTDRWSARPGERVQVAASTELPRYRAELTRLRRGGPRPGREDVFAYDVVDSDLNGEYDGRKYELHPGSFAVSEPGAHLDRATGVTLRAWIYPTKPNAGRPQGIVGYWSEQESRGIGLYLDDKGALAIRCTGEDGEVQEAGLAVGCAPGRWYLVVATVDFDSGDVTLEQLPQKPWGIDPSRLAETLTLGGRVTLPRSGRLCLGAGAVGTDADQSRPFAIDPFNGKVDSPAVASAAIDGGARAALRDGRRLLDGVGSDLVAEWDLALGIETKLATDRSRRGNHATLVNGGTRAVTGHNWDGTEIDFRRDPAQYGAIHFHDDDLIGADWPFDLVLEVPEGLESGPYAIHLTCEDGEEFVPFFVLPPIGKPGSKVAFLAPTMTYMAYSNFSGGAGLDTETLTGAPAVREPADYYLDEHRELGWSMYNTHDDGSGIGLVSMQRPMLNIRPQHAFWLSEGGGWGFSSDMFLIDWLEHEGYDYDVITDHDVHREGLKLLRDYEVVISGTHPEYNSEQEMRALEAYLDGGGRFMYLGGNGWYWVTTVDIERPDVMELRRGLAGLRTWGGEPGESHHSMTGEPGGLWRFRGRAPQRLVGVGFSSQGGGASSSYVRTEQSDDPRVAFIFEGVGRIEEIGAFGDKWGGAAGEELDRLDFGLGSPRHALLIATSSGRHSNLYQRAIEELLQLHVSAGHGGEDDPDVRSDLVYFETPNGGEVFSVGSINWTSSLSYNDYENNVSQITANVLRKFSGD